MPSSHHFVLTKGMSRRLTIVASQELPGSKKKQLAKMANVQLPSKKGVAAPLTARTTTLSTITTHKDSTAHLTPFPVPEYNPSTATIMARRSSSSSIASSAGVSRMSSIGSLGSFGAGSVAGSVAGSGSGKGSAKQKYLNLGHSFAQPTASGSGAKGLSLGEQLGLGRRAEGDGEGNMADEEKGESYLTHILLIHDLMCGAPESYDPSQAHQDSCLECQCRRRHR